MTVPKAGIYSRLFGAYPGESGIEASAILGEIQLDQLAADVRLLLGTGKLAIERLVIEAKEEVPDGDGIHTDHVLHLENGRRLVVDGDVYDACREGESIDIRVVFVIG